MKKRLLLTLMLLAAASAAMSAQDEPTEQTPTPVMTLHEWVNELFSPDYGDGYKDAFVEITYSVNIEVPDDMEATIYYRCLDDGYNASEWMEYSETLYFFTPGCYTIEAYAQAYDRLPSEVVSVTCCPSQQLLYRTCLLDGIYYYFADEYSYDAAVFSGGDPHYFEESDYSGEIVIPGEIECRGAIYTVNEIYDNAFTASDVVSVDLPNTITRIGYGAFFNCAQLRKLTCRAINPPVVYASFQDYVDTSNEIYQAVTLFVPAESLEAYRSDFEWGQFARIVPFIGAGPGDIDGDGAIDVSDVTRLVDKLLSGEELPAHLDVDGNGSVEIKDLTTLIDILLGGN
jgi:hypothetical protein